MGEITPLGYLLELMNDKSADPGRRDRAARAAAPFCHPKMDAVPKKVRQTAAAEAAGEGTTWEDDLAGDWQQ